MGLARADKISPPELAIGRLTAVSGPKAPALWQTIRWMVAPQAYLDRCRRKYGKTFYIDIIDWGRMVMTSGSSLVRDALTNRSGLYSVAEANATLEPVVGKYSVFVREGKDHGLARGQIKSPLGASALSEYRPWLADLSQECLGGVKKPLLLSVKKFGVSAWLQ